MKRCDGETNFLPRDPEVGSHLIETCNWWFNNCITISGLGRDHCTRPSKNWCTHNRAIYQAADCDGDGYIDQYCHIQGDTNKVGVILSKENCQQFVFELKLGSSPVTCASLSGKHSTYIKSV